MAGLLVLKPEMSGIKTRKNARQSLKYIEPRFSIKFNFVLCGNYWMLIYNRYYYILGLRFLTKHCFK